jgi:hypothetical protein
MSTEFKQDYCRPIQMAVDLLVSQGCILLDSADGDPHFKEVNITLRTSNLDESMRNAASVSGIEQVGSLLRCTCHWSTITLTQ